MVTHRAYKNTHVKTQMPNNYNKIVITIYNVSTSYHIINNYCWATIFPNKYLLFALTCPVSKPQIVQVVSIDDVPTKF